LCWGNNGLGGVDASLVPVQVPGMANAVHVSAGGDAACAALRTGEVSCWGSGQFGEAGYGQEGGGLHPPRIVPGVTEAVEVAATGRVGCARTAGGRVFCWGGAGGGCGAPCGSTLPVELSVTDAVHIEPATHDDENTWAILILTGSGRLLGFGGGTIVGLPLSRVGLTDLGLGSVADFSIGYEHTNYGHSGCVVYTSGASACTGSNADAAFGDTAAGSYTTFRPAFGMWASPPPVEIVTADTNAACARFPDGSVRCNGACLTYGLRGDGCATESGVINSLVTGVSDVVDIVGHDGRTCVLEGDGDVWCWGPGDAGQLGYGGVAMRTVPTRAITD
jgi:alpha-tubulin suppressor-like RCC1 family protein